MDADSAAAADLGGADAVVGIVVADFDFEFAVAIVAAADEVVIETVRVVVDIAAEVAGMHSVVGVALLESHAADDVAAVHSVSAVLPLGKGAVLAAAATILLLRLAVEAFYHFALADVEEAGDALFAAAVVVVSTLAVAVAVSAVPEWAIAAEAVAVAALSAALEEVSGAVLQQRKMAASQRETIYNSVSAPLRLLKGTQGLVLV